MWIAATAMVHGMTLVTKNLNEFQRVAGLPLVTYECHSTGGTEIR